MAIHAIEVDGRIQRIDGSIREAERAIDAARQSGAAAIYLFDAHNNEEYERRKEGRANPNVLVNRFSRHPFMQRRTAGTGSNAE